MQKVAEFTRKRALSIVFFASLIIFLLILGRWLMAYKNENTGLSTIEGRQMFLAELGWEIDPASEEAKTIVIPEALDAVLTEYNSLQIAQGYDLTKHLGEDCCQYTYLLTNYENANDEDVYICIYVQGQKVIAGDIHTNSMNGFMHGIKTVPKV